ncbi:MAG: aldehyde dehydrogenase family protein [Mycobacterium sp.]
MIDPVAKLVTGRSFRMLIGGDLVDARAAARRPVTDPSTGHTIAEVPEAEVADVASAVSAAVDAQNAWARLTLGRKIAHLERFAEILTEHAEELAFLEAIDTGNPLFATRRDIDIALNNLREWPAIAQTLGSRIPRNDEPVLTYITHNPYGVVGRITAFNHPALFAINGTIMPLLAGNTIVVKSSELAPLSTFALGELFAEAMPKGVVNLVSGGAEIGDALVTHPEIKRLTFIGSVPTGLRIQERAAQSGVVKNVSLELGGKNAMVVFPDVDIDQVVSECMRGMSLEISQGQSCQATSRVLVHDSIYDDFVGRACQRLREYRMGVAYEEGTQLGPLISEEHRTKVTGYIELGLTERATLMCGGEVPEGPPAGGFYLSPALFADVEPQMRLAQEEVFGPVITAMRWSDYEAMIKIANGVDFGLSASVWSSNIDLALGTAARLEAGYVWVNDTNRHYANAPYGGFKNSGIGRAESLEELLSYLEIKSTHVRLGEGATALARINQHLTKATDQTCD